MSAPDKQRMNDESEPPLRVTAERHNKLAFLVQESRAAQSLAFLNEVELETTIAAWARVLRDLPLKDLFSAYEKAIRAWNGKWSFGAPDIYRAWTEMAAQRQYQDVKAKLKGDVCSRCQGTGFEPVMDSNGKHLGVRPCTVGDHRG